MCFIRKLRYALVGFFVFLNEEYLIALVDLITPRGGGHRDRRRDLRIPSPISPTPLNLFPGNRCGGLIGLPRVYRDIGFRYPVLSLIATSTWCLGALCSILYRSRFSRFCWVLGRSFFIIGGMDCSFLRLRGVFAMAFRRICANRGWVDCFG